MSGYTVAHLDEIEEASDGRCPWRPVRQHFGITAYGASAWTGRNVGDRIINEHDEREREPGHLRADDVEDDANEELYLVHRGRARFELDGDHGTRLPARSCSSRPVSGGTAFAEEPGTTIAVGGIPGKAYEPVGREVWRPFHPVYESGAYAEVVARGRELIEASGYPEPLYNLACCESLLGRTAAIEHLRLSLDSTQRYRERLRLPPRRHRLRSDPRRARVPGADRRVSGGRQAGCVQDHLPTCHPRAMRTGDLCRGVAACWMQATAVPGGRPWSSGLCVEQGGHLAGRPGVDDQGVDQPARAAPMIALALSAPTEIPTTCGMRRIRSGVMPSSRGSSG